MGENEYGYDIWEQFPVLDKVIYWRIIREKKAYSIIYQQMIQKDNQKN
jgi:hypothetical protein